MLSHEQRRQARAVHGKLEGCRAWDEEPSKDVVRLARKLGVIPKGMKLKAIPEEYLRRSDQRLRLELLEVGKHWREYQKSRDRNAVYDYLAAVYRLVRRWIRKVRIRSKCRRALKLCQLPYTGKIEPFTVVIYCTANRAIADGKTRSKWSRVLRYAAHFLIKPSMLEAFLKENGGLNETAGNFARYLGPRRQISQVVR